MGNLRGLSMLTVFYSKFTNNFNIAGIKPRRLNFNLKKENIMDANEKIESEEARVKSSQDPSFAGMSHNETGGKRLLSFIERVERLNEEKAAISEDVKEIFSELKGVGFNVKAVREIIKLRKLDKDTRDEQESIVELYKSAIGMN